MNASKTWGIIVSIVLIAFAVIYPVPEKRLNVSSSYSAYQNSWADRAGAEYVGGDAYNYQMEASLKAGYVSGVLAMKGITFVGGILLFFHTLFSSAKCKAIEAQTALLGDLKKAVGEQGQTLKLISKRLNRFAAASEGGGGEESVEQSRGGGGVE